MVFVVGYCCCTYSEEWGSFDFKSVCVYVQDVGLGSEGLDELVVFLPRSFVVGVGVARVDLDSVGEG